MNIYIPNDLAKKAKREGLNISAIAQSAIETALAGKSTDNWLASLTQGSQKAVSHQTALRALDADR